MPSVALPRGFMFVATIVGLAGAGTARAEELQPRPSMENALEPFVSAYCIDCHSGDEAESGLSLDRLMAAPSVPHNRLAWKRVVERVAAGEMPPEDSVLPEAAERDAVLQWLNAELADPDCSQPQNPGRVTMRRLNRTEYQNTIVDLLGVEFDAAAIFPQDELAYGFDNNGDVLSLPTVLLEKYLQAAETIAAEAIVTPESIVEPAQEYGWGELHGGEAAARGARALPSNGRIWAEANLEQAGDYILRVKAFATHAGEEAAKMRMFAGSDELRIADVWAEQGDPQTYIARFSAEKGRLAVGVDFINDAWEPWAKDVDKRDRNLFVMSATIVGPLKDDKSDLPESHRQLITYSPTEEEWRSDKDWIKPTRKLIRQLLGRAYRRPPAKREIDQLIDFVAEARQRGDSFERAMQLTLQATLVSPNFLMRGERAPQDAEGVRPLNDYELASRLSYFLWSSMPDDELLKAAAAGTLQTDLDAHIERMLESDRSDQLIRNFGEQWLETRALKTMERDVSQFPEFDEELRSAMREETYRLLVDVFRNDRPLTTLLSADYSFVNARLAKHYGIEEPAGDGFQRVELPAERQAGLLVHGSVLAATSYEDRTSPVLRGKWVLERLLAEPPPPPPANVGSLPEATGDFAEKSQRERLEAHRADPTCASCHKRMDPIGLAMENFDAVGRWRENDGKDKIDASGELPDGRKLTGPASLRDVLLADFPRVRRSLAEQLLTYALGRGLEPYDFCAVSEVVAATEAGGDTFSSMVRAVAKSAPFQQRHEGD